MVFFYGKIPFMNATAEIDKAGRLVVPKKMRDALHLVPGSRLTLDQQGESIVIRPESNTNELYKKQGLWVYHGSSQITPQEVHDMIEKDRETRERRIMGEEPAE